MNQKVTMVARTCELDPYNIDKKEVLEDLIVMSGKAAGMCYMPNDYLSAGIHDKEKAFERAEINAKNGHYSVYEHAHISFIIQTTKIMAMILNSMGLYATSEKSSRYTKMDANTQLENSTYEKWIDIMIGIVKGYYPDLNNTKVNRIAMENARYMLSIYSTTKMLYTVPFSRAILTCEWLDTLANDFKNSEELKSIPGGIVSSFYNNVADQCKELAKCIRDAIGITDRALGCTEEDKMLKDHKNIGIDFFTIYDMRISEPEKRIDLSSTGSLEFFGDYYCDHYLASFAMLAQAIRHRTLHYKMYLDKFNIKPYVPEVIKGTLLEKQWISDFNQLIESGIIPQCTLVSIEESGRFEDFVLKAKERLCAKAQLEICVATKDTLLKFKKENLSSFNGILYDEVMPESEPVPRCCFKGYECKEPCIAGKYGLFRKL